MTINDATYQSTTVQGKLLIPAATLDLTKFGWAQSVGSPTTMNASFAGSISASSRNIGMLDNELTSGTVELKKITGIINQQGTQVAFPDGIEVRDAVITHSFGTDSELRISGVRIKTGSMTVNKATDIHADLKFADLHATGVDLKAGSRSLTAHLSPESTLGIKEPVNLTLGSRLEPSHQTPIRLSGSTASLLITDGSQRLTINHGIADISIIPGASTVVKGEIDFGLQTDDLKKALTDLAVKSKLIESVGFKDVVYRGAERGRDPIDGLLGIKCNLSYITVRGPPMSRSAAGNAAR